MVKAKDIKIEKVRDWVIYFSYRGSQFFLKGQCDGYEYAVALFNRVFIDNGRYDIIWVGGHLSSTDYIANEFIRNKPSITTNKRHETFVYNQLDMEHFVSVLEKYKLAEKLEKYVNDLEGERNDAV